MRESSGVSSYFIEGEIFERGLKNYIEYVEEIKSERNDYFSKYNHQCSENEKLKREIEELKLEKLMRDKNE